MRYYLKNINFMKQKWLKYRSGKNIIETVLLTIIIYLTTVDITNLIKKIPLYIVFCHFNEMSFKIMTAGILNSRHTLLF